MYHIWFIAKGVVVRINNLTKISYLYNSNSLISRKKQIKNSNSKLDPKILFNQSSLVFVCKITKLLDRKCSIDDKYCEHKFTNSYTTTLCKTIFFLQVCWVTNSFQDSIFVFIFRLINFHIFVKIMQTNRTHRCR